MSADPISGEFARLLDGGENDREADDIAALIQEVDLATSAETGSIDAASDDGSDSRFVINWPQDWQSQDDVGEQIDLVPVVSQLVDEALELENSLTGNDEPEIAANETASKDTTFGRVTNVQARAPPTTDAMPRAPPLTADNSNYLLSDGKAAANGSVVPLTQAQLDAAFLAAINLWSDSSLAAGLTGLLDSITVQIADLDGTSVGAFSDNTIYIDATAAGHGWFIDTTPGDNSEFGAVLSADRLAAGAGSDAEGRVDLLTVLLHEIGHSLGFSHNSPLAVMRALIGNGERFVLTGTSVQLDTDTPLVVEDGTSFAISHLSGSGEISGNDIIFNTGADADHVRITGSFDSVSGVSTIVIESTDTTQTFATQTYAYSGTGGGSLTIETGIGSDSVDIVGNLQLLGVDLVVKAEAISVESGTMIDTGSGDISLLAFDKGQGLLGLITERLAGLLDDELSALFVLVEERALELQDSIAEVTLPIDYFDAGASLNVAGAVIHGGTVIISATADTKSHGTWSVIKVLGVGSSASVVISDSDIEAQSGDLTISSLSTVDISGTAQSLSTPLVDAATAVSVVVSTSTTNVGGMSTLSTVGDLNVTSNNAVKSITTADGKVGGVTSAGGAAAVSVVINTTKAFVDGAVTVKQAQNILLAATSSNEIATKALATGKGGDGNDGGIIGKFLGSSLFSTGDDPNSPSNPLSLAGSLALTVLVDSNEAYVNASDAAKVINASGEIDVKAIASHQATTLADSSSTNTPTALVGLGVAAAANVIVVDNTAYLSGDPVIAGATKLSVTASMPEGKTNTFEVEAISGAGSGGLGGSGSFGLSVLVSGAHAYLDIGTRLLAGDADLILNSVNRTISTVKVTAQKQGATGFGAGGSLALNVGVNTTRSEITGTSLLSNIGALTLTAEGKHLLDTTADAGAAGAVAITPAAALTVAVNNTEALVADGTAMVLAGGLTMRANHTGSAKTRANAAAAGKSAGFGVAFGLTVVGDHALATLGRDLTSTSGDTLIEAHTLSDAHTTAIASALGAKPSGGGTEESADDQVQDKMSLATGRSELQGIDLPDAPSANTETGGIRFGAALGINIAASDSIAEITSDGSVNAQGGSVSVLTSNDTDATVEANGSAVGTGSNVLGPTALAPGEPAPLVKGGDTLTFADKGKKGDTDFGGDTLARTNGSWKDDGFAAGDKITISGTSSNNTAADSTYTIASISADGLTLSFDESVELSAESKTSIAAVSIEKFVEPTKLTGSSGLSLTFTDNAGASGGDERDTIVRGSGSWSDDGFSAGDAISITGTGSNDSGSDQTYTIKEISEDGLTFTIDSAVQLTSESLSSSAGVVIEKVVPPVKLVDPTFTFKDNQASSGETRDSITLSSGSWTTRGFSVGDTIGVTGTSSNDGTYKIAGFTTDGGTVFLTAAATLSDQTIGDGAKVETHVPGRLNGSPTLTFADNGVRGDTITRSAGSWVNDGFAIGDVITVSGTGSNDNTYTISAISEAGKKLTLADGYFLDAEATTASQKISVTLDSRAKTAKLEGTPVLRFVHDETSEEVMAVTPLYVILDALGGYVGREPGDDAGMGDDEHRAARMVGLKR